MKMVKSSEEFDVLVKVLSETIQNESNKRKSGFLGMLLSTLDANL